MQPILNATANEIEDFKTNLRLVTEPSNLVTLQAQPSVIAWKYAKPALQGNRPWKALARFDIARKTIFVYPIRLTESLSVLKPKYLPLTDIVFEGYLACIPREIADIEEALAELPEQFYTEPTFGLGIRNRFRALVDALGHRGFRELIVSRSRNTAIEGDTVVLAQKDFSRVAYEVERIGKRFADQSRAERLRYAHNELLARYLPDKFPRDDRPYREGLIVSFVRKAAQVGAKLSDADRAALVQQASAEASTIAKRSPRKLYQLQRDFQLAGLEELIERLATDIEVNHPESHWQKLFKLNPFVLTTLFGYPVVVIRDQAHLGGTALDGSGETIVDFLVRNQSTQSLALVEIKKPDTPLVGRQFRAGRCGPSSDLNAAVIQIIDQRYELLVNYKDRARDFGAVHAVDCVVVAGRTPPDCAQSASFEMYRASLRDVRVFTFDEVLMKLRALHAYLAPSRRHLPPRPDPLDIPF